MKRVNKSFLTVFFALLLAMFNHSLFAFDRSAIDFSIKPKTSFTKQTVHTELLVGGLVELKGTAIQNKKDLPLPDKKLRRGFKRFQKVDAFGDDLPDRFLLYRQNLTSEQKSAYDEIFKVVMNGEESVNLITRIHSDDISSVIEAVYFDNPEPFWWACDCDWYYNPTNKLVTSVQFGYLFPKSERPQKNKEFFNLSLPIIFYANLLENDMDKIKYVHDYLCNSIDYDVEAFNSGNYGGKLQTAYSAIVEYKTVCAGYARAFAYYMQQLRIPCTVLHGSGHAWNLVEVDGEWYQMDVTWDDGSQSPAYFNLPHSEMQKVNSHIPSDFSRAVISSHPSHSERLKYANYFGSVPIGQPYTYKEFNNIESDIESPAFAKIYRSDNR